MTWKKQPWMKQPWMKRPWMKQPWMKQLRSMMVDKGPFSILPNDGMKTWTSSKYWAVLWVVDLFFGGDHPSAVSC